MISLSVSFSVLLPLVEEQDLSDDISGQPRPQGFSLVKQWVGREKALASAGHVSPRTP